MSSRLAGEAEQMLEELRRARDAAEAASRAKDAFLATMSHELRTPMTTVIGSTQLLLETELDEEQRHAVESVHRAGKVLLGVINDVLDYSKIGSGKLELTSADFDLHAAVLDVIETLRSQADRKGLALQLEVARGVPRWVKGDSLRLGQVLTNLVANAIKFTSVGSVRVYVDADELRAGFRLRFTMLDTGIGLAGDVDRLFEPFAQGDESTTRRYGGTGLGLAIAKQLVQLMGGAIAASDRDGQGSSFRFDVRVGVGSERSARLSKQPPRFWRSFSPVPGARRKRLLLAEDNDTNRSLVLRSLEPLGAAIDSVRTGRAALEAALATEYDVILMDCQMPELDGFEAAAAIRQGERPGRRVPIVALTANALYGDRERCLAAGMDDYLPKPFSVAELRHKVRLWMLPEPVPLTVAAPSPALVISEAAPEGSSAAIDARRLHELATHGGRSLVEELAAIFVADARRRLSDLLAAIRAGDAPDLRRAAHALKGASGNVGATRLCELAASLEHADPLSASAAASASALESELARVEQALGPGLEQLLARAGIARRA
jgi:CheY-like chemotaxis protein